MKNHCWSVVLTPLNLLLLQRKAAQTVWNCVQT